MPDDYLSRTGYRLPSEAEWEYACRAQATTARFYGQADEFLVDYAWLIENSQNRTWPVGRLMPNGFGLFDVQGNVWEWCQNAFREYDTDPESVTVDREDDIPFESAFGRIQRGGAFDSPPSYLRSAFRPSDDPSNKNNYMGFRVTRTYAPKSEQD